MYPHRIRLRGPWECTPLPSHVLGQPIPDPSRVKMPGRWADQGLTGFSGRVRYRRAFGYPGQIDSHERVWLTIDAFEGQAEIRLNDTSLGSALGGSPLEFDVTSQLCPRNDLVIELEGDASAGLCGEIALEVRCAAFLRNVRLSLHRNVSEIIVTAEGELVGHADGLLELYLLMNRRTVGYESVQTEGDGVRRFSLPRTALPPEVMQGLDLTKPVPVQVDLVKGAVVWYTLQSTVMLQDESQ